MSFMLATETLPQVIASGMTGRNVTPEAMTCDGCLQPGFAALFGRKYTGL